MHPQALKRQDRGKHLEDPNLAQKPLPNPPSPRVESARRAVIDVGTNSVKLLVAEVAGREARPIWEEGRQTRLGEDFYRQRRLQTAAISRTAAAVADYRKEAERREAASISVIATSAARDAVNADELIIAIESASGLKVQIISGDQEADWAFEGVRTDPRLTQGALLLLDVGGGSAQFILGEDEQKLFRQSYPMGAVRLMEKIPHSDPPKATEHRACQAWLREFLGNQVLPKLGPLLEARRGPPKGPIHLVATGGTAAILARIQNRLEEFDRDRIEATRLTLEQLRGQVENLWGLPLERRRQIPGLPSERADVMLTGAVIYESVMEELGFDELRVSTRGLRFAAVMAAGKRA